jgi:hypothetical protein
MKPKVYIPNRSTHDFSAAEIYGDLVFLSSKNISSFKTNRIFRKFYEILKDSDCEDYILLTGLTALNVIAAIIMEELHGRVNLLIFNPRSGKRNYVERVIMTRAFCTGYELCTKNGESHGES